MITTEGKTSLSMFVYFVQDDSGVSPGEPHTGMLFSDIQTGGSGSYVRAGAARVGITLVTLASASAAWSSGGFILVDDTNLPGVYRIDIPDAALVSGVDQVALHLVPDSGQNAVMRPVLIDLTSVDLRDAVRMGMTALPNVAAGSAGGLPDDTDANGAVRIVDGTGARELNTNSGAVALVDLVTTTTTATNVTTVNGLAANVINAAATDADHIDLIWDELLAGHVTADTAGLLLNEWQDGGRLDLILDIIAVDTTTDIPALIATAQSDLDTITGSAGVIIDESAANDTMISDAVWDELMAGHAIADTAGLLMNEWQDGGRLDAILDIIAADVVNIDGIVPANAAAVNTEVVDALNVDTITLPGQEAPPLTPTHRQAISWLYKVFRNRTRQTATLWTVMDDAQTTVDAQATVSDDSSIAIKEEVISGP